MPSLRLEKKDKDKFESLLKVGGPDALFSYVVGQSITNRPKDVHPEVIILDKSEAFFSLYRKDGGVVYFTIAKVLRRAAHKLYRQLQKINKNYPKNGRFLNIVK
jgi:hypothetical protein